MMSTSKVVLETTEVDSKKSTVLQDVVVKERQVNLLFNGQELGVMDGLQDSLRELALGFLFTEGYLRRKDELKRVFLSDNSSLLMVETLAYEPKEEDFTRPIGSSGFLKTSADSTQWTKWLVLLSSRRYLQPTNWCFSAAGFLPGLSQSSCVSGFR